MDLRLKEKCTYCTSIEYQLQYKNTLDRIGERNEFFCNKNR